MTISMSFDQVESHPTVNGFCDAPNATAVASIEGRIDFDVLELVLEDVVGGRSLELCIRGVWLVEKERGRSSPNARVFQEPADWTHGR